MMGCFGEDDDLIFRRMTGSNLIMMFYTGKGDNSTGKRNIIKDVRFFL